MKAKVYGKANCKFELWESEQHFSTFADLSHFYYIPVKVCISLFLS